MKESTAARAGKGVCQERREDDSGRNANKFFLDDMLQLDAKYTIASHWAVLLGKEFLSDVKGAPDFGITGKVCSQIAGRSHCTEYYRFAVIGLVPLPPFPKR